MKKEKIIQQNKCYQKKNENKKKFFKTNFTTICEKKAIWSLTQHYLLFIKFLFIAPHIFCFVNNGFCTTLEKEKKTAILFSIFVVY